jgi:hypothetical protein
MPSSPHVCDCISHSCALHETKDEWGVSRKGKRLAAHEYWEHRMHDKRLKYLSHEPNRKLAPDVGPEDDGTIGVDTPGNSITPSTSYDDELAHTLQNCLSAFQSGSANSTITEDLAFCEPSEDHDWNTPPPLQSHAIMNADFLEYQGWVATLFLDADKIECGGLEHCELIKKQLVDSLQDEWNKLEDIKLRAWKGCNRARKARAVPPPPPPGLAQIVDTCSSFLWVPVITR